MSQIPTLDIRRFDSDRAAFVAELGATYREWGFCGIRGHGIPDELIQGAYDAAKAFFALPEEVKMKYHQPGTGGARGYTPFGIETAKDSKYPDLKEFWHVGREIARDSEYAGIMGENLWPAEVPQFKQYLYGLYSALDALGSKVLSALARQALTGAGPTGPAVREPQAFYGFEPFPAEGKVVTNELIDGLRDREGV